MTSQRYISKELTHFIGRQKENEEEQYNTLIEILETGLLKYEPHSESESGYALGICPDKKISNNTMYDSPVVCFCDIPIADLAIHINKYSHFGISFLKSFLIEKGANPVFYVANNSIFNDISEGKDRPRGELFDNMFKEFHEIVWEQAMRLKKLHFERCGVSVDKHLTRSEIDKIQSTEDPEGDRWNKLHFFLDYQIFSFIKFFDADKSDEDPKNYYMEREWRIIGDVKFNLNEVHSIILPKAYANDLREDIPEYYGQIIFSDYGLI